MYIEYKGDGIAGPGRIGRVSFSKSGKSIYYKNRIFETLSGKGFKSNYYDVETGEDYWISGCRKDGKDALYSTTIEIDDDVREEYWRQIRNKPENKDVKLIRVKGKYTK